jgi:hypothetical protein
VKVPQQNKLTRTNPDEIFTRSEENITIYGEIPAKPKLNEQEKCRYNLITNPMMVQSLYNL